MSDKKTKKTDLKVNEGKLKATGVNLFEKHGESGNHAQSSLDPSAVLNKQGFSSDKPALKAVLSSDSVTIKSKLSQSKSDVVKKEPKFLTLRERCEKNGEK